MRAAGYADLPGHIAQHQLVQDQLTEMYDEYHRTPDPPDLSQEIMQLLNFWIVDHILKVDMKCSLFFLNRNLHMYQVYILR